MATALVWRVTLRCPNSETGYAAPLPVRRAAEAPLLVRMTRSQRRECECHDMFDQLVPYAEAWRWQKALVDARCATAGDGSDYLDEVIVLQHPPVYTMGTRSSDEHLRFNKDNPPFELHRTERGGEVTYHGPGQLVMYPILNLRRHRQDLHWYLRSLEEVVIKTLKTSCGLQGSRLQGLTGVWIGDHKVAAIGVRVCKWFTYHGLALNVSTDLAPFKNIVPCGIADRPVGSIFQILAGRELSPYANHGPLSEHVDATNLLALVHVHLLQSFSEVFDVELVSPANLFHHPNHAGIALDGNVGATPRRKLIFP